jgi:hypothetical protein
MININITDLVPAQERTLTRDKIQELVNGEAAQHDLKMRCLTKDGCEVTAHLSASASDKHKGEVVMIVVTERHPD